jgi:hypothetical protein
MFPKNFAILCQKLNKICPKKNIETQQHIEIWCHLNIFLKYHISNYSFFTYLARTIINKITSNGFKCQFSNYHLKHLVLIIILK